jgi:hypothetical protein
MQVLWRWSVLRQVMSVDHDSVVLEYGAIVEHLLGSVEPAVPAREKPHESVGSD